MKIKQHHLLQISIVGFLLTLVYLYGVTVVHGAGEYTPLVGIPGVPTSGATGLPEFFNRVYLLTISLGVLFGILKIAFAGVKYSTTDVLSSKQSAREDIKGVIIGLLILLGPALVLQTINPKLTNLDILSAATKINLDKSAGTGSGTGAVAQNTTVYPKGTTYRPCTYDTVQSETGGQNFDGSSEVSYTYDNTGCRNECANDFVNGRFIDRGGQSSICVYQATDNGQTINNVQSCLPGYAWQNVPYGIDHCTEIDI